jgi:hypothetical protein
MSTKHDHALIEETVRRARARRRGAVVLVGLASAGVVAVTTAWTSDRTAARVHLYWANSTPGWRAKPAAKTIGRARLDGTGAEHRFLSGTGGIPCGVALDRTHVYWAEVRGGGVGRPTKGGGIGRANRDGSGVNASFIPTRGMGDCGVTIAGSHIYWARRGEAIARASLDGTGVDLQFIPGLASKHGGACGIAVAGKYIYWGNVSDGRSEPVAIGRANLDGTGVNKRFITGVSIGCGIAAAGGHIYWTNLPDAAGAIGRANLDGTGVNQRFIRTAGDPGAVAVYRGHVYWCQEKGGLAHPSTTIGRANLNGSAVNNQFITGIHHSCRGLAVG